MLSKFSMISGFAFPPARRREEDIFAAGEFGMKPVPTRAGAMRPLEFGPPLGRVRVIRERILAGVLFPAPLTPMIRVSPWDSQGAVRKARSSLR